MIVVTSKLGLQVLQHLQLHGPHRGIHSLALTLRTSYPWLRRVLLDLERQGVVIIERNARPYLIRLREDGGN